MMLTASKKSYQPLEQKSPTLQNLSNKNITVRFKLNDFETIAQVYPGTSTIAHVLDDIASKFQLLSKYLSIKREKYYAKLPKTVQLSQICTNDFGIVDVQLGLSDLAKHINDSIRNEYERIRLDTDLYYRHYRLPDFISVTVPDKDDVKSIVVEIVNIPIVKPFLGGYINKLTEIEYHHAFTQTGPIFDQKKFGNLITRDTQTTEKRPTILNASMVERESQTPVNNAECPNPPRSEYKLTPRPYKSFDEVTKYRNQKAAIIQKNFRTYLWLKLVKQSAAEWRQRMHSENEKSKFKSERSGYEDFSEDSEIPRTRRDFDKLESNVRQWKENQIQFIKENVTDKTKRQFEFNLVLTQEIKLLNEIEKKRAKVNKQLMDTRTEKLLDDLGAPIRWIGYKNISCEMDLLRCQKIRKLTTLYRELKKPASKFDRIEFIGGLSYALKQEQHSPVLEEFISLLEREQHLLVNNIDNKALALLHNRQNELFCNFIKSTKTFKPIANTTTQKVCSTCKTVRSLDCFEASKDGESETSSACKMCDAGKTPAINVSIYRAMLRSIRREERKRNALSSCAFIISEEDLAKIVEHIWHCRSILSQSDDIQRLRLSRWNLNEDWTPWNCILLTDTEALAHLKIADAEKAYSDSLIRMIETNNSLAKNMFAHLKDINGGLRLSDPKMLKDIKNSLNA